MNLLSKKVAVVTAFLLCSQHFGFVKPINAETVISQTEFSETTLNPNLSSRLAVFPKPIYFKDTASNNWLPDWDGSVGEYPDYQASISESLPNSDSSDQNLTAGTHSGNQNISLIKFGNQLPDLNGGLMYSADLHLFEVDKPVKWGYWDPVYINQSYTVHKILDAWEGGAVTWSDRPEISGPYAIETMRIGVDGGHFKWDVSQMAAEWYDDPAADFGLAVQGSSDVQESYRSFYSGKGYANKSYDNMDKAPRLMINFAPRPVLSQGSGFGLQANSSKGYVRLKWNSHQGIQGYKLSVFNGEEYETIDIGMMTEWTSLGKGLWPTAEAIQNGAYRLALDASGSDMPDNPSALYRNAGGTSKDPSRYYFKITAYNEFGESAASEEISIGVPDQTAPQPIANPVITEASPNKVKVKWDRSEDATGYHIKVGSKPGLADIGSKEATENEIEIDPYPVNPLTPVYVSIAAKDGNGNMSLYSPPITGTIRIENDAKPLSSSMPFAISVDSNPVMAITMENLGSQAWTAETGFELRSINADAILTADPLLPEERIEPGETKTFLLRFTGKKLLGPVSDGWQMYQHEKGYFGNILLKSFSIEDKKKPEVTITSPQADESLYKTVNIRGTIKDETLESYSLSYANSNSPEDWKLISSGTASKANESISSWDTSGLAPGEYILRLEALDKAGNTGSLSLKVSVNLPVAAPIINPVSDQSTAITGGVIKTGVTVFVRKGTQVIGKTVPDVSGFFSIPIPKQPAGTPLAVYVQNNFDVQSEAVTVKVSDKTAPAEPTVNTVSDLSLIVSGKTEKGATITVKKGDTVLGYKTAGADGAYTVPIQKQKAGTVLSVTAKDASKNISSAASKKVIDKTPPPAPSVPTVGDNATSIKGLAEKGTVVSVKRGTTLIGSATAAANGAFTVKISKQKAGTAIIVTAKDAAGNISAATNKKVADKTPPSAPVVYNVYSSSKSVSGKTEPYATVTVKRGKTVIGTAKATSKGAYSVKIKPQSKRVVLTADSKDTAGNKSKAASVIVK
ncbi:Ig-like domain-containing protein [Planomicrobium sp. CPCC 101079]|uniref:Ig-like domain-containing protein n=1 Tax=Planomicrobium sp. CPCC 101079 TaxID=2599618 RepID=UPI0011B4F891|nr:Ig-like domain-containing protein [Planomicrobium sp. CPCC 101079]TWT09283.1 DNRLRE domain-containing protein [Planomicrobium sp. CPCC 101079]